MFYHYCCFFLLLGAATATQLQTQSNCSFLESSPAPDEYVIDCSAQSEIRCVCMPPAVQDPSFRTHIYMDCEKWLSANSERLHVKHKRLNARSYWKSHLSVSTEHTAGCVVELTAALPDSMIFCSIWILFLMPLVTLRSIIQTTFQNMLESNSNQARTYPKLHVWMLTSDVAFVAIYVLLAALILYNASDPEQPFPEDWQVGRLLNVVVFVINALYLLAAFCGHLVTDKPKKT